MFCSGSSTCQEQKGDWEELLYPPGHWDDCCGWITEAQLHSSWDSLFDGDESATAYRFCHQDCSPWIRCFPLSFLWSILLSVVISLQGGEGSQAEHAASCFSCRRFKAEHISLTQIHDHISFMALQLWVRCFLSRRHVSPNVILQARVPADVRHIQTTRAH